MDQNMAPWVEILLANATEEYMQEAGLEGHYHGYVRGTPDRGIPSPAAQQRAVEILRAVAAGNTKTAAELLTQPFAAGVQVRLFTDGCAKWQQYPGGAFVGWPVGDVLPDYPEHAPTRISEWLLRVVQEVAIKQGQVEEVNAVLDDLGISYR